MIHNVPAEGIKNAILGIITEILYALFVMSCAFLVAMVAIWWIK
ncbi:MAG: hypothetical protein ABIH01_00155 [Candidatus Omnitrophota bacterium]